MWGSSNQTNFHLHSRLSLAFWQPRVPRNGGHSSMPNQPNLQPTPALWGHGTNACSINCIFTPEGVPLPPVGMALLWGGSDISRALPPHCLAREQPQAHPAGLCPTNAWAPTKSRDLYGSASTKWIRKECTPPLSAKYWRCFVCVCVCVCNYWSKCHKRNSTIENLLS